MRSICGSKTHLTLAIRIALFVENRRKQIVFESIWLRFRSSSFSLSWPRPPPPLWRQPISKMNPTQSAFHCKYLIFYTFLCVMPFCIDHDNESSFDLLQYNRSWTKRLLCNWYTAISKRRCWDFFFANFFALLRRKKNIKQFVGFMQSFCFLLLFAINLLSCA